MSENNMKTNMHSSSSFPQIPRAPDRSKLHMHIVTRDAVGEEDIVDHKVVNYLNHNVRVWISKHLCWAMNRNLTVTMYATDEDITFVPKVIAQTNRRK